MDDYWMIFLCEKDEQVAALARTFTDLELATLECQAHNDTLTRKEQDQGLKFVVKKVKLWQKFPIVT